MIIYLPDGKPIEPQQTPDRFIATHLTAEQIAALRERLAKYSRRRRAAERGDDWRAVR